eukprot:TRINITY_DN2006_c1_g1_i1.p1 TRINITY_DN2006_c1_g1~~TRINITY_DN2006_c1_g1_i1.p1  ORF type:complete len:1139 (-),score=244.67 TRINITY_DN2006_c1_g1_i1:59-3475(-)
MEQYDEVRTLGRGAFGVAVLVKLKDSGATPIYRVVKQVNVGEMTAGQQAEAHKEVGVLRQLSHPHIVAYFDTFFDSGALCIVMEYADGGDLSSAIKTRKSEEGDIRGPFKEDEALSVFGQCMLALQYIHGKRIVHRDIKSQNIFLMDVGSVKIGDFGIAKVQDSTTAAVGTVIGTPTYFAPEICENQPYSSKVDIWAMGVVLFELLTLNLPFQSNNIPSLVIKIVTLEVPALPDTISQPTAAVVSKMLQKAAADRPNAVDVLQMSAVKAVLAPTQDDSPVGWEQYEKIEPLGRGAFGVAFLVRLRSFTGTTPPMRVIKTVELKHLTATAKKGAQAEVELLRRLAHPHIVAYFDFFIQDETLHIVLEYADGGDLAKTLRKRKEAQDPFNETDALMILRQCLLALTYIHSKKILHRDIKSQNIFLMKSGDVKLGDFGISKVMDNTVAEAGTAVGTPAYLAPELCNSSPYGVKVDIWSLGVVLYELLTLQVPFQANNMVATIMKIVNAEPPPLPDRCSSEASEIVKQVLHKQPDQRPTAAELLAMPCIRKFGGTSGDLTGSLKTAEADASRPNELDTVAMKTAQFTDDEGFTMTPMRDSVAAGFLEDALLGGGDSDTKDSIDGMPKRRGPGDVHTTAGSSVHFSQLTDVSRPSNVYDSLQFSQSINFASAELQKALLEEAAMGGTQRLDDVGGTQRLQGTQVIGDSDALVTLQLTGNMTGSAALRDALASTGKGHTIADVEQLLANGDALDTLQLSQSLQMSAELKRGLAESRGQAGQEPYSRSMRGTRPDQMDGDAMDALLLQSTMQDSLTSPSWRIRDADSMGATASGASTGRKSPPLAGGLQGTLNMQGTMSGMSRSASRPFSGGTDSGRRTPAGGSAAVGQGGFSAGGSSLSGSRPLTAEVQQLSEAELQMSLRRQRAHEEQMRRKEEERLWLEEQERMRGSMTGSRPLPESPSKLKKSLEQKELEKQMMEEEMRRFQEEGGFASLGVSMSSDLAPPSGPSAASRGPRRPVESQPNPRRNPSPRTRPGGSASAARLQTVQTMAAPDAGRPSARSSSHTAGLARTSPQPTQRHASPGRQQAAGVASGGSAARGPSPGAAGRRSGGGGRYGSGGDVFRSTNGRGMNDAVVMRDTPLWQK